MPLDKTEQHVALSPVDDDGFSRPRPGVALCLSGGGYRAMIFHLGVLWRLNELGYLARLDRISSVSGGSITAGLLGLRWGRLDFAGGVARGLVTQVVEPIRAFAHITGGGFYDNVPRVLPRHCDVVICKGTWDVLPIFQFIAEQGGLAETELYHVFNMGIGMVLIVDAARVDAVMDELAKSGEEPVVIGKIVEGTGVVRYAE